MLLSKKTKKTLKLIAIILGVAIIGVVGWIIFGKDKPKQNQDTSIEEKVIGGTKEDQGDYKLTNVKISSSGSLNVVTGKIKNMSKEVKNVDLKLLMSNSEQGQLLGTSTVTINDLKAGETKDFEVSLVGSYDNINTYEVRASDSSIVVTPTKPVEETTAPIEE